MVGGFRYVHRVHFHTHWAIGDASFQISGGIATTDQIEVMAFWEQEKRYHTAWICYGSICDVGFAQTLVPTKGLMCADNQYDQRMMSPGSYSLNHAGMFE